MKIFLTGATGFVGSYFLRKALIDGHEIVALRSRSSSFPVLSLPKEPQWLDKNLGELVPGDIQDCAAVVHTASAGVPPKKVSWLDMVQTNVMGTASLIDISRHAGIERFIASGTYQELGKSFLRFKDNLEEAPLAPYSLYGASKASGFHLLSAYAIAHKMELYYPRITHVYGIGAPEKSFWCALRSAALEGSDFKMSIGDQIVDYIHVEEVAGKLLQGCTSYDLKKGEPMVELIGSGRVQSLLDFAQLEWEKFGAAGRLLPGQYTG